MVGAVAGMAVGAVVAFMLLAGDGEEVVGPTIPVIAAVTPDPSVVAALQPVLAGMPEPEGDTDRDQVRSLLGPPDSLEISFELADGGKGDRLIRYETWYYFELLSAFEFADGDIIRACLSTTSLRWLSCPASTTPTCSVQA